MIGITFQFINEIVEVSIDGLNCLFKTQQFGGSFVPIERLKLDKKGVIKEFPDLKDNSEWRKIAMQRFNEKLASYKTEMERANYLINDLKKFGYAPLYIQRKGFRTQRIKQ